LNLTPQIAKRDCIDEVGVVRLEDGREARVGRSVMGHEQPEVGRCCLVDSLSPHPISGLRVGSLKWLDKRARVSEQRATFADRTDWVLARIRERDGIPTVQVQSLIDCVLALQGAARTGQVFGIDVHHLPERRLLTAIKGELRYRHRVLDSPTDRYKLDNAGRALGFEFLRLREPAPPAGPQAVRSREGAAPRGHRV
jgi:hypothetical protein